jgi:hypothetical protein
LTIRVASMLVLSDTHMELRMLAVKIVREHASITKASILVTPDTDIET